MENNKTITFQTIAVDFDGTLCFSKWPEIIELYGNNSRKITCDYYIDDRMLLPEAVRA